MRIDDLIKQLQKISDQRGNPEIVIRDPNDWRRHRTNITVTDLGLVTGVLKGYGFIPEDVINNLRGFNSSTTSLLKSKSLKQMLLISI